MKIVFKEYPKWIYRKNREPVLVKDKEERKKYIGYRDYPYLEPKKDE